MITDGNPEESIKKDRDNRQGITPQILVAYTPLLHHQRDSGPALYTLHT